MLYHVLGSYLSVGFALLSGLCLASIANNIAGLVYIDIGYYEAGPVCCGHDVRYRSGRPGTLFCIRYHHTGTHAVSLRVRVINIPVTRAARERPCTPYGDFTIDRETPPKGPTCPGRTTSSTPGRGRGRRRARVLFVDTIRSARTRPPRGRPRADAIPVREVYVKWTGYYQPSWEPLENFEDIVAPDVYKSRYRSARTQDRPVMLTLRAGKAGGRMGGRTVTR